MIRLVDGKTEVENTRDKKAYAVSLLYLLVEV